MSFLLSVINNSEYLNAKNHNAECHNAEYNNAECHYAECHYAECHSAECHYAKCRAVCFIIVTVVKLFIGRRRKIFRWFYFPTETEKKDF